MQSTALDKSQEFQLVGNDDVAEQSTINATQEIKDSVTPEIIIALCGPIGSPLHETAEQISFSLKKYGYKTYDIRLSDLIRINSKYTKINIDESTKLKKFKSLITVGDKLREIYGSDILAKLAIAKISAERKKNFGEFDDIVNESSKGEASKIKNQKICHIIDSVKNSSELELLKSIYGKMIFSIGVFSPLEARRENLSKINSLSVEDIAELINTDSGEEFDHGQSVRDTFPKCDYFLRVDSGLAEPGNAEAKSQILSKLERFFKLIFRSSVISPTEEENAMYAATSAARNSACLSRQVGAAVTSSSGELLSTGWNDVPRNGGGLYGKQSIRLKVIDPDHRCYALQNRNCSNDAEKRILAEVVIDSLVQEKIIPVKKREAAIQTIIKNSRLKDLIEFSRAVHAEMHAILGASRVAGERILGGKIFVTTYPCHSCARHIIASGISEVYFIEPYRKSLALKLHSDAMTESVIETDEKVKLIQFDGVAPTRFLELFESGSRKSKAGVLELATEGAAMPVDSVSLKAIPKLEQVVIAEVDSNKLNLLRLE
ncbi:anti-phage dCTP deaminase [Pectobacterium odoriferum]|uniref:anti-phage dCTP deaminase n=1 Tax=Pectobacterium odoriferum TaxID=78398 RepID=UPI000CD2EEA8|nr:anti-phage dCTP deaminase [Pectobacterium odoriferum]POD99607.1 CMP deaminase [Pectobacterium odoriferum]